MSDNFKIIENALDCVVYDLSVLIEQSEGKQKNHLLRARHLANDALANVRYARAASPKRELEQWQNGVVAEKKDLDEKIEKLEEFLDTSPFLSWNDRGHLVRQYRAMQDYSDALNKLIKEFGHG